jgi:hypothetical protein
MHFPKTTLLRLALIISVALISGLLFASLAETS